MPAVAQSGVQPVLPGLNLQKVQNLLHADGDVHPRRGTALLDHLGHGVRVFLRVKLLIFLLVALWVRAGIADAPLVPVLLIFHLFPPRRCEISISSSRLKPSFFKPSPPGIFSAGSCFFSWRRRIFFLNDALGLPGIHAFNSNTPSFDCLPVDCISLCSPCILGIAAFVP